MANLDDLEPSTFEHLVNALALRVLGPGYTTFGPGSDGGRDGYFEGEAPYPSVADRWSGTWYVQSKYHRPHLSSDSQKWLLTQIQNELREFERPESKRVWPTNWIVATNIDPSGRPETGAFDAARKMVEEVRPELTARFHIWGGKKLIDLLTEHNSVLDRYRHLLTSGHLLSELFEQLHDVRADLLTLLQFLIVRQFDDQLHTKLEQAGSTTDARPGIHKLFIDLPFRSSEHDVTGAIVNFLAQASAQCQKVASDIPPTPSWRRWLRYPSRSRGWFLKGGPGQGKSTIAQYYSQIHRAAAILSDTTLHIRPEQREIANEVRARADSDGIWPTVPRVPVTIELKDYAHWYGGRASDTQRGMLSYLASRIEARVEQPLAVGTLKRALRHWRWLMVFDGLDEVPHDVKDAVAGEVKVFINHVLTELDTDALTICTSRPQGYSGQFDELTLCSAELLHLNRKQALACAEPVLKLGRSPDEAHRAIQVLSEAIESASVRELMKTPLQAHIMAVIVRDGAKPPERRWQLFTKFYEVIKQREANRNLPDRRLAKLLREDDQLLRAVHSRLGFVLHARAETSRGAQTHLSRTEFAELARESVSLMTDSDISDTVDVLMRATTDRLVLVSTPDDGNHVRFDIRQLQEFFAAEFLYHGVDADILQRRMMQIAGDSHWREVMHFLMSALIENVRATDLAVAVDVLETLNDDEDPRDRFLARRVGRGALLGVRLLSEGVLEQDKRVRQLFRRAVEPVTASLDADLLRHLHAIASVNTRAWILNVLFEALKEGAEPESVGAASALSRMLPDSDERSHGVQRFLRDRSAQYVAAVVEYATGTRIKTTGTKRPPPDEIPMWITDVAFERMVSPDWSALPATAQEVFWRALQSGSEVLPVLCRNRNLSVGTCQILQWMCQPHLPGKGARRVDYGLLVVDLQEPLWKGKPALPNIDIEGTGIVRLASSLARFANEPMPVTLRDVLASLEELNEDQLTSLPANVLTSIPVDTERPLRHQLDNLLHSTTERLQELIDSSGSSEQYGVRSMSLRYKTTAAQWRVLVAEYPRTALLLWSERLWARYSDGKRPRLLDSLRGVEAIVNLVIREPSPAYGYVRLWGRLMDKAPRRRDEIARSLRAGAAHPVQRQATSEFFPFELRLPDDAPLLPHLVNALLEDVPVAEGDQDTLRAVQNIVAEMVRQSRDIWEIAVRSSFPTNVRAAATLISMLHAGGPAFEEHIDTLLKISEGAVDDWYFNAFETALRLVTTPQNKAARTLVGAMLSNGRENFSAHKALVPLLQWWRESSAAPVWSSGLQHLWLAGDG